MVNKFKFSVLGCGHGAHAVAGYLALKGNEVCIVGADPVDSERVIDIKEKGGIEFMGTIKGFAKIPPENVTLDIKKGVEEKDIILLVMPSFAHEYFFKGMVESLNKGQVVVIIPGNFGSIRLVNILKEKRGASIAQGVTVAESSSLPFACRLVDKAKVDILAIKDPNTVPLAAIPAIKTMEVISILKAHFYEFEPADNVLEVALNNVNFPIHPVTSLFTLSLIEYNKGNYDFYGMGITPAVSKIMEEVDKERREVGRALGLSLPSLFDLVSTMYKSYLKGNNLHELLSKSPVHTKTKGPDSLTHRYIMEDVPFGLVPILSLGTHIGIECPTIKAIVHLWSIATGIDLMHYGLTVDKLGMERLKRSDEILSLVKHGVR